MRLYHLTSAEFAISSIALKRLKIARFGDLNDPFELLAAEQSDKDFRKAIKSWKEEFHKTKGLICFSENWRNPVLWSHYAEKHRGICLGFDVPEQYALSVTYRKKRVPIRFQNKDPDQGLDENFVDELLRTKYEHWAYEAERRMFVSLDEGTRENGIYFYDFDESLILKEIIVGPLCEVPLERIESLAQSTNGGVVVRKARLAFKKFEVVVDQRYEER